MVRTLLSFIFIAMLSGCVGTATTKLNSYDTTAIQSVKLWTVDFVYESGRSEKSFSEEKGAESKVVTEGRSRVDLKLRDDISFALKDNFKIDTSRNKRSGSGEIQILPIRAYWGFVSVDVEIVLPNGEVAGRLQVRNGDRNATIKNDAEFAEYATIAIANALRGLK